MVFTKEAARREGRKRGSANARRKLTLERVERELLSLESPQGGLLLMLIGAPGFEPGTSCSQSRPVFSTLLAKAA